jgi:hypothetical protein
MTFSIILINIDITNYFLTKPANRLECHIANGLPKTNTLAYFAWIPNVLYNFYLLGEAGNTN